MDGGQDEREDMIPKVIHYCWFGRSDKPKLAQKCINSWKRYCPDYKIQEWNEDNFDITISPYMVWCYDHKKWAFLSDYARLLILEQNGGIYLDTDVEIIKCLDPLLQYDAYFGFEETNLIATGLGFGTVAHHKLIQEMMVYYQDLLPNDDGNYTLIPCPKINTSVLLTNGLAPNGKRQNITGAEILPIDYLNPYDDKTGRLKRTVNSYSIHWYGKSWMLNNTILRNKVTRIVHRAFGVNSIARLKKLYKGKRNEQ